MNSEIKFTSSFKFWPITVMVLGFIWCIVMLSIIIHHDFIVENKNLNIGSSLAILLFSLLSFICLKSLYSLRVVQTTSDQVILRNIWTKRKTFIPKKHIKYYSILEKSNSKFKGDIGYFEWTEIVLNANDKKYKLSSLQYSGFEKLKKELKRGLQENRLVQKRHEKRSDRNAGIISLFLGVLFISLLFLFNNKIDSKNFKYLVILSMGFIGFGIYGFQKK